MAVEVQNQELDADTKKILEDMAAEAPKEEPKPEEPKVEAPEPEPTPEPEADTADKEDESEAEEETELPEKVERTPRYMPISKFQKQKAKWESQLAEREAELATLRSQKPEPAANADLETVAQKHGIGVDVLADITQAIRKQVAIPESELAEIKKFKEFAAKQAEEAGFERDYTRLAEQFPDANDPKVKAEVKKLAYTEKLANVPLQYIYKFHFDAPKKPAVKTAEPSRTAVQGKPTLDFDNVTSEQISNMSDAEFAKYSDEMAKRSKHKIVRH